MTEWQEEQLACQVSNTLHPLIPKETPHSYANLKPVFCSVNMNLLTLVWCQHPVSPPTLLKQVKPSSGPSLFFASPKISASLCLDAACLFEAVLPLRHLPLLLDIWCFAKENIGAEQL